MPEYINRAEALGECGRGPGPHGFWTFVKDEGLSQVESLLTIIFPSSPSRRSPLVTDLVLRPHRAVIRYKEPSQAIPCFSPYILFAKGESALADFLWDRGGLRVVEH